MLNRLVASAPARGGVQSTLSTGMSVAVHALLVFTAVQLTMNRQAGQGIGQFDTTLVFIDTHADDEPERPPEIRLDRLERGFVALIPPVSIPTSIPPVDLTQRFDPRDYTGVGIERPVELVGASGGAPEPGKAWVEALVDEKPSIISSPPLRYPDLLREAGLEGAVLVEVIIDADGMPEPASLRIVQSTHRAFEPAAREVVMKSLYRPGRVRGETVRVLVNVPVTFSIYRQET